MKLKVGTHKPHPTLWVIALLLFICGFLPLPYADAGPTLAAALLLVTTTII